jgi:hypothetical protein
VSWASRIGGASLPASLGGRRVNNGIYCERHNNGYGALAATLSNQLAFFNAQFRIRNTRTKQIQPVTLTDPASGEAFEYDGNHLKPKGVRILSQNGNSATIAVSERAQIQRFLEEQQAKGLTYQVSGLETALGDLRIGDARTHRRDCGFR